MYPAGSGQAPTIVNPTLSCTAEGGTFFFTTNKAISGSTLNVTLTRVGEPFPAWGEEFSIENAKSFTIDKLADGDYSLISSNGEAEKEYLFTVYCKYATACDLVVTEVKGYQPGDRSALPPVGQSDELGYVIIKYTTSNPHRIRLSLTGTSAVEGGYDSGFNAQLYNLPLGPYAYKLWLEDNPSCAKTGTFTLSAGEPVPPTLPPPPSPNPEPTGPEVDPTDGSQLAVSIASTRVSANVTTPGQVVYRISGAASAGALEVNVYRAAPVSSIAQATHNGNGTYSISTLSLVGGSYQVVVTQNAETPYAATASAAFRLVDPPYVAPPVSLEYVPGPAPIPYEGSPYEPELADGDGFLLVQLRQTIYASHALSEPAPSISLTPTVPLGADLIPGAARQGSQGFAQRGLVSGETASRLDEVRGFDAENPFVVGEHGVSYVDSEVIEYTLNQIGYRTQRATGVTVFEFGYVSPVEAGLISSRGLYARDEVMYHERRPLINNLRIERNDQPVLLDFYAVARATNLDELPPAATP